MYFYCKFDLHKAPCLSTVSSVRKCGSTRTNVLVASWLSLHTAVGACVCVCLCFLCSVNNAVCQYVLWLCILSAHRLVIAVRASTSSWGLKIFFSIFIFSNTGSFILNLENRPCPERISILNNVQRIYPSFICCVVSYIFLCIK